MTTRYDQLLGLIDEVHPHSIIEIGVHRAYRAASMVERALKYADRVHYTGFDVFETMGEKFHEEAMNGKGIAAQAAATARLKAITAQRPGAFTFGFVVGDTRQTLRGKRLIADFVFIDGDHRLSTIRSDYAAVQDSRCVVFDDYLVEGPKGELPDISNYGANLLVRELQDDPAVEVRLLPKLDLCRHGGYAGLVAVLRKE